MFLAGTEEEAEILKLTQFPTALEWRSGARDDGTTEYPSEHQYASGLLDWPPTSKGCQQGGYHQLVNQCMKIR